jgi:hypothetical protein
LTCKIYTSWSAQSAYSNSLLFINSKKHIDNNYFKISHLRTGLPTSSFIKLSPKSRPALKISATHIIETRLLLPIELVWNKLCWMIWVITTSSNPTLLYMSWCLFGLMAVMSAPDQRISWFTIISLITSVSTCAWTFCVVGF